MSNKDKINELIDDLRKTLENNDIEDALTLICMIENAKQLDAWLTK